MSDESPATDAAEQYSDSDVLDAVFAAQPRTSEDGTNVGADLYLRTYELVDERSRTWRARPAQEWPCIATIQRDSIVMYPVHANPHTQRYLRPKHGQVTRIVYVDRADEEIPADVDAALSSLGERLDHDLFDPPSSGLGFCRDLDCVWQQLSRVGNTELLVVARHTGVRCIEGANYVGVAELRKLLREFKRVTRNGRQLIRQTKHSIVHDEVLTKLDPEKFQRIMQVDRPLVEVRREGPRQAEARLRSERRASVRVVRSQVSQLVQEAPRELMELHAEIERVTVEKMIEAFQVKLNAKLSESHWQAFFEQNKFVLSMAFARPVELATTQFHARGSSLDGTGAQIGDFLFRELGQALAIVEIKTPETPLLQASAYRGKEVFGPHAELSGAVTQVLFQQSELRQRWHTHVRDYPALRSSDADVVKCVVIAGRRLDDPIKMRSLEVFRNACKDVDVITFDELLEKLRYLQLQLTPQPDPPPF